MRQPTIHVPRPPSPRRESGNWKSILAFNRTTRSLQPTEKGWLFHDGACRVLEAIDEAKAAVGEATQDPHGTLFVTAPLCIGRRYIAPRVPAFMARRPLIDVRLRLSDRVTDAMAEGLDMAFHPGVLEDSPLKVRLVADRPCLLCAALAYIARCGRRADGAALVVDRHDWPNLRVPGAPAFQWALQTTGGPRRFEIAVPFESDDGDVRAALALDGRGMVPKPVFEVAEHLRTGRLVRLAEATLPLPVQLSVISQHRRLRDPKVRLFADFTTEACRTRMGG